MKTIHKSKKYWRSWAVGFLNLAKIGLKSFETKKDFGKEYAINSKKIYGLKEGHTIVAIIWNIKHGIELLIKALGVQIDREYKYEHDLALLIKELDSKLKKLSLRKNRLKLIKIVDKYYRCDFFGKGCLTDFQNTVFKYPESNTNLDYSLIHTINIHDLLKDVGTLELLSGQLEGGLPVYKSAKKFGIKKKEIDKRITDIQRRKNKFN